MLSRQTGSIYARHVMLGACECAARRTHRREAAPACSACSLDRHYTFVSIAHYLVCDFPTYGGIGVVFYLRMFRRNGVFSGPNIALMPSLALWEEER